MLNLITTGVGYIFPCGRTLKLIKDGIKISNSTNPIIITKNITLVVIDCCTPPPVRLAAHCISAASLIGATIMSPNPLTLGATIHTITEIYDNC